MTEQYADAEGFYYQSSSSFGILQTNTDGDYRFISAMKWDAEHYVKTWGHRIVYSYRFGMIDMLTQVCGCVVQPYDERNICDCMAAHQTLGLPNYHEEVRGAATDVTGYIFKGELVSRAEFILRVLSEIPALQRQYDARIHAE